MSSRNEKDENAKYSIIVKARVTKQIKSIIKAKALEQNVTESEIVRQAIFNYINENMSDSHIIHAAIAENTRKMKWLEKKTELLGLLVMQQTRLMIKSLPDVQGKSEFMTDRAYEEFLSKCQNLLRHNRNGFLESMVLDAYEKGDVN